MNNIGNVVSINRSSQKGVVKIPIANGVFIDDFGLKEDAHGGVPIRQVSLLGLESIHKMEDQLNKSLPYGSFAENLTTEGIELFTLPIGTILKIGETIQEVSKIGKECHKGCAIFKEVGKCIMPVEGIFTKVIQGGMVKAGDTIIIERQ